MTRGPDGALKGCSPLLDLYLCWVAQSDGSGLPAFYDAVADRYLQSAPEVVQTLTVAEARAEVAETEREAERMGRLRAEARADAEASRADGTEAELQRLRNDL